MSSLWQRIRRRKLVQWTLAYLAGSWLVLQVVDLLADNLGWPGWVFRVGIALLAVGFFAALVLAWYHGERGRQRVSGMEVAMLAGILVMAGAAVAFVRDEPPSGPGEPAVAADDAGGAGPGVAEAGAGPSIAVLPLENLSPDPENAYFADGIHEEILTRLSKDPSLKVISRTSVMGYRETTRNLRAVAAELGVNHVLEGSVRRAGDRLRITTQLIDARTDGHVWAETYDRDYAIDELFEVQSDIAAEVTRALRSTLGEDGPRPSPEKRPTRSLPAYEAYMRGRSQLETWNARGIENAVAYFREAVAADSGFALAYAGIAEAYSWGVASGQVAESRAADARRAAARALALDEELGEAHTAQAILHYYVDRDWEKAERRFRRGLELSPNDPSAHHWFGHLLMGLGRVDEALEISRRGYELDPLSPAMSFQWGYELYFARRYADAVRELRRTVGMGEEYPDAVLLTADALAHMGRREEADSVLREVARRWGVLSPSGTGCLLTELGRPEEAERHLELLRRNADASPAALARLNACLGNAHAALDALERSLAEGEHPRMLVVEPHLDAVRGQERYRAVLEARGLPVGPISYPAPGRAAP